MNDAECAGSGKPGVAQKTHGRLELGSEIQTQVKGDMNKAVKVGEDLKEALGAREARADENIAKVSAVGVGMRSHSGVASKMFKALADEGINIDMISTSEIKISCVVSADRGRDALRALHTAFKLGETAETTEE